MKRFYCTICKKVKRVRNYPATISMVAADNPTDRKGQCSHHPVKEYMSMAEKRRHEHNVNLFLITN